MAIVESSPSEVGEAAEARPVVVLHTEIRGSTVSARWEGGRLHGDEELVRRLTNLAVWRRIDLSDLDPAQVIGLAREACAAPVETDLLL